VGCRRTVGKEATSGVASTSPLQEQGVKSSAPASSPVTIGKKLKPREPGDARHPLKLGRKNVGHISGAAVSPSANNERAKDLNIPKGETFLEVWGTRVNGSQKGTGTFQKSIQELASSKEYPAGVVVPKYQASPALQKALRKIPGVVETKDNFHVKGKAPQYAVGETTQQKITRDLLKEVFPGQTINTGWKGEISVTTKGGANITIMPNADIKIDMASASKAYKKAIGKGDVAHGSFQMINGKGVIQLAKTAGKGTVKHEAYHAAEELVLTDGEVATLKNRYGNSESRAQAYAEWDGTVDDSLFQRIKDFFQKILNATGAMSFDTQDAEARKIFRELYSGLTWSRKDIRKRNQIKIGDIVVGALASDPQYALDAQKWEEAPQHLDIFGTVNNRLSKELEVIEKLLGPLGTAQV